MQAPPPDPPTGSQGIPVACKQLKTRGSQLFATFHCAFMKSCKGLIHGYPKTPR